MLFTCLKNYLFSIYLSLPELHKSVVKSSNLIPVITSDKNMSFDFESVLFCGKMIGGF